MPQISKTVRFEVFKRDCFACHYCGASPPAVILEIDHIIPKSDGGPDEIGNLITACFACNRGKGARSLGKVPQSLTDRAAALEEAEAQLAAYARLLKSQKRRLQKQASAVEDIFRGNFPDRRFTPKFMNQIKQTFLRQLPAEELIEAIEIACNQQFDPERTIKYFCGVCWRKIKEADHG